MWFNVCGKLAENSNICLSIRTHIVCNTVGWFFKQCNSFRCPLFMECVDEGLSEVQKRARVDRSAKFVEQMKKLEEMAKNPR